MKRPKASSKDDSFGQSAYERRKIGLLEPSAIGKHLGTADAEPEEAIGKSISDLCLVKITKQFLPCDMANDCYVRACRLSLGILGQDPQIRRVPRLANDGAQDTAFAADNPEGRGELSLVNE
jgi:hypothetical protein